MILPLRVKKTKMTRILAWRSALRLENKRLTWRGKSTYSIVRAHFSFNGNRRSVLAQLDLYIDKNILPGRRSLNDEDYTDIS